MNPVALKACMMGAALLAVCPPAIAAQQAYTYAVVHPLYGEIGTYTHAIDRTADMTRVDTHLRVAVRLLGMVAYHEESDGSELLRGGRLVSLQTVTNKDGKEIAVRGEAQGDQFVVSSPRGTVTAPADVALSDPWFLKRTGAGTVVSPKTGKVEAAQISGGVTETIVLHGVPVAARHFTVVSDKQEEVWLDCHDIPVMFRTVSEGTRIDFVLSAPLPEEVAQAPVSASTGYPSISYPTNGSN